MCSDCEACRLKKHGLTRSDCILTVLFCMSCVCEYRQRQTRLAAGKVLEHKANFASPCLIR